MIGSEHARILNALPETSLVACCDIDPAARANSPGGVFFTTEVEEALAIEQLEAVFVCVPQHLHRVIVEQALQRRLAVFCEKPIASRLEDADAMIRLAAEHESLLVIGHTLRFDPGYIAVHTAVQAGEIGDLVEVAARWVAPSHEGRTISGRTTVPQEMMIHDIDVLRWLAGPIERVYAEASPLQVVGTGPDVAVATLRFRSGAVGVLDHSWIGPDHLPSDHQLSVFGTAGALFCNSQQTPVTIHSRVGLVRPNTTYYSHPNGVPYGALPSEDRFFARCVREREDWPISLNDARAALECALAIESSAGTGQAVSLPRSHDE
jgi:predicted dehydrogenase